VRVTNVVVAGLDLVTHLTARPTGDTRTFRIANQVVVLRRACLGP
jgi:hypothetical protein